MKKTSTRLLGNSLLLFAILFTILSTQATAQTQAPSQAQTTAQAAGTLAPVKLATPRITQAISEANLVQMHSKVHPLARAEFDRGVVADSLPVNRMLLVLKRSPEQETALRTLMDAQQTKNSPLYHSWLTPTQFGQQFGVADADIQKVTDWLSQKGFTGVKVGPGHMFIEFNGTAGLVRAAFHTEMHNFMVKGEMHTANVSVPQMPAALSPVVSGIHALHNFRKKSFMHYSQTLTQAKAAAGKGSNFTFANACGSTGTQPCAAVGPADFAKIYNLPPTTGAGSLDGTGQTIAIVARSNINVQDVIDFRTGFGLPNPTTSFTAANNIVLTGPDPGIMEGDDGEATLDVEWSGAVAPNAKILLVVSDSQATGQLITDGVDYSALYIVENNLAPIMSESFGACEAFEDNSFIGFLWEQAAAQGITVMVSSGDNGSAGCDPDSNNGDVLASTDGPVVSGTASTPFNVAVGGTDFDDASNPSTFWTATNTGSGLLSAKSYIPEVPWNDSCASAASIGHVTGFCTTLNQNGLDVVGGSGGPSQIYAKPTWQAAAITGIPADGARDLPDVSLFASVNSASNNFYVFCLADSGNQNGQPCSLSGTNVNFSGVGGTSVSSPAFAGIVALINQSEVAATRLKAGEGQGNINYVLYPLALKQQTTPGTSQCNSNGTTAPNVACVFNDVTKGNNSVACDGTNSVLFGIQSGFGCSVTSGNGILVEAPVPPYTANAPAWSATAGYDMATGLGSVNVSKLIAGWGAVTGAFIPTTTTITAPAPGSVSIAHGANVNFTATVTSGSGTPTGDVSLIAKPTAGLESTLGLGILGNGTPAGTVSLPSNFLPGGTYPVVAHYAGDGTFAASDSAPFSVTVTKENSVVQTVMGLTDPVSGNITQVTSAPYGSTYLFRVDILGATPPDNVVCETVNIPCPTGTITLTDTGGVAIKDFLNNGTSTNVATLNSNGFLEDRLLGTTGLTGGAHNYTASYSGDASYNAKAGTPLAITITAALTATSVTANGSATASVNTGQSVTLVATVPGFYFADGNAQASNGAGPTGTITFSSCGTAASCTVTVVPTAFSNSNGDAFATGTLTIPGGFTTAGVQNITATFTTADTNYSSCVTPVTAPAVGCSFTAAKLTVTATQTGSFTVGSTPVALSSTSGAIAGSTITVTPSGGFTGAVAVTPTAGSLPAGVSCTPSPLNINVTSASAVTSTLNCQVVATSTTLTASNVMPNGMLEAKANPSSKTRAAGLLTLGAGTGFAAIFLMFLPGGRKKLRAALGLGLACILALTLGCNGVGSGGGGGTTKTATTTQLTVTSAKVASGTAFTFSVKVTGGTPTGQVELLDNGSVIGTMATVTGGTATPTAPALSVGTHKITAAYLGDATTLGSPSGALNLTVTGTTTIAITTNPVATPAAPAISVTIN